MKQQQILYHLFFCLFLVGCRSKVPMPEGMKIYFKGTKGYVEKVKELKLSYDDVIKRCMAVRMQKPYPEGQSYILGEHPFIVNDSYVFIHSIKSVLAAPLFGYYVNGNTGEVSYNGLRNTFVKRTGTNSFYLFEENAYPSLTPERMHQLQEKSAEMRRGQ